MSRQISQTIIDSHADLELSNANEATTRLRVIDRILKEVLHWTEDDITPELRVSEDGESTYADYVLRTANTAIVVEAKKAGHAFESTPGKRREKLTQSFVTGERGKAIIQARDYARKLSIDYAVATNGSVWIIFPAQRHDQVPFQESTAIVFWSLDDALKDNYQEFVDLLGRESAISGSLESTLLGRTTNQLADRRLNRYFNALSRGVRSNPIYSIIDEVISITFSDSITQLDPSYLERCYVATPETLRFDSKIQMTVARRSSVISSAPIRPMKPGDAAQLDKRLREAGVKQKPIALLLLGSVGSGKTTFLHYLRKVKHRLLFEPRSDGPYPHWCHLDFLENTQNVPAADFIYERLFEYIQQDSFLGNFERCTRHAYAEEIQALRSGPLFLLNKSQDDLDQRIADLIFDDYKKKRPYVDKVLRYAVKNAPFFLVIDNVDQIENDSVQSKLFTEALSIARNRSLNLILCLRQSTFTRHRNSPVMDAFDFEVVQIDPPRIASVLSKRFALAKQLLEGKKSEFVAENGIKIKLDNTADIIGLVQGSVLGTEIGNLIEVLATDDVRLSLRMTREFLERGYTDPGRAIEFHKNTGAYLLPKHEAYRAIMLGTSPVYREDISSVGNIFDSRLSVDRAQLLRLFVLNAIVRYASESRFQKIDGSFIAENMRRIGFGDNFTEKVLVDLCKHRFLFTEAHGEAKLSSSFIPSRLGGYVVRELLGEFTYVENVMFDTYIAHTAVWSELRKLSQDIDGERDVVKRVRLRVKRVQNFYAFIGNEYRPLTQESLKRGLPAEWCDNPLENRKLDLRRALARALRSARRNYSKSKTKSRNSVSIDNW